MQATRNYRPKQPSGFSRLSLYLTIGYTLLLAYGTLFPLSGWRAPGNSPWALMLQHELSNTSKPDILTNLIVYLPFGAFLVSALPIRYCPACRILVACLAATLLSLSLEHIQAYLPGRVPSIGDWILNTIGGCAGALLVIGLRADTGLGSNLNRVRTAYILPGPLFNFGLIILWLWALSQLSPLVPSLDVDNLRQGLKPLWDTLQQPASLEWLRLTEYALSITALGLMSSTLFQFRYHTLKIFAVFAGLVLLLKVPVLSRQLSLEALLGLISGLILTALFYRQHQRARLMIGVIALLGTVIATGIYTTADIAAFPENTFNWIPFRSHLTNDLIGVIDILGMLWPFLALVYLAMLATSAHRLLIILSGTVAISLMAFTLEWYQQFIPGRSPDITDVIIAVLAWICPWLYKPLTGKKDAAPPRPDTVRSLPHVALITIVFLTVITIGSLAWKAIFTPLETPSGQSTQPLLPAPSELPPVQLANFRHVHPRLPAPSVSDIVRLQQENPAYLNNHKNRASNGKGDLYSAILTAYYNPGSIDLNILHQRLMGLQITWRGHEQAKPVAIAYDWLYDQWSEEQQTALRDRLISNAEYLIHRIREKQRLSPYNVYLYNSPFQALVATTIAVYRDDPRSDVIMRYTHDYWKNRVLPVWRQIMGKNGGWHEGGEYVGIGIGQAVYQVPAMWRKATGEDLFIAEPGIRGFLDFLVYRTRPDGTHFRWGDGAFFNRFVPDQTALAIEYHNVAAYSLGGCPTQLEPTSWPWGPLTDDSLCNPDALSKLPLAHYFDGIGMVVARSDWSPEATFVTFKAGDNYWSHNHLDQGGFTIYKGGALAIDSGLYGGGFDYGSDHHMNYSYQTVAHNTVTVRDPDDSVPLPRKDKPPRVIANDGGQRRIGSGWGIESAPLDLHEWQKKSELYETATMERIYMADKLVIAVADLTPAYTNSLSGKGTFSHRTRRVNQFNRTFAYDQLDDVILIFDRVESADPTFNKRWLHHTRHRPQTTANGYRVWNTPQDRPGQKGGQLDTYILLPQEANVNIIGGRGFEFYVDGKNYDEEGQALAKGIKTDHTEPGHWRIEVHPEHESLEDVFFVILIPANYKSEPQHEVRILEEESRIGCEIAGPGRTTRWWFDDDHNGPIVETFNGDNVHRLHDVRAALPVNN